MTAQHVLEFLLVFSAVEDEPVGCGIADAVAENHVQAKAHLVDEVVHVAFEAAIVIAGEK